MGASFVMFFKKQDNINNNKKCLICAIYNWSNVYLVDNTS